MDCKRKKKKKSLISEPFSVNTFTSKFPLETNYNIVSFNNYFSLSGNCLLQKSVDSLSMQKKIRFTQTSVTYANSETTRRGISYSTNNSRCIYKAAATYIATAILSILMQSFWEAKHALVLKTKLVPWVIQYLSF